MHVCLLCHCLCVCLSPCCCRARQAVPIKRAQGELLWQQLPCCAVLCVCVCACVPLSPGRAGQTGPVHMEPAPLVSFVVALGVFPTGAWSVQFRAASSHGKQQNGCFSVSVLIFPLISLILQSALLFICLIHSSFGPFCLLNLLFFFFFFIYMSLSQSLPPLSPWPHHPSLSVRIHQLSGCVCVCGSVVSIHK